MCADGVWIWYGKLFWYSPCALHHQLIRFTIITQAFISGTGVGNVQIGRLWNSDEDEKVAVINLPQSSSDSSKSPSGRCSALDVVDLDTPSHLRVAHEAARSEHARDLCIGRERACRNEATALFLGLAARSRAFKSDHAADAAELFGTTFAAEFLMDAQRGAISCASDPC